MNDTHPAIEALMYKMIMQKSPIERATMGFSMFESVKAQVMSTIEKKVGWRKELFLRFYANDFDEETKQKILKKLGDEE